MKSHWQNIPYQSLLLHWGDWYSNCAETYTPEYLIRQWRALLVARSLHMVTCQWDSGFPWTVPPILHGTVHGIGWTMRFRLALGYIISGILLCSPTYPTWTLGMVDIYRKSSFQWTRVTGIGLVGKVLDVHSFLWTSGQSCVDAVFLWQIWTCVIWWGIDWPFPLLEQKLTNVCTLFSALLVDDKEQELAGVTVLSFSWQHEMFARIPLYPCLEQITCIILFPKLCCKPTWHYV